MVYALIYGIGLENLLDKNLAFNPIQNLSLTLGFVGLTLLIGIISGLYPVLFLSSIGITSALKGTAKSGRSSMNVRKVLVAFQFFISTTVIISTLLMKDQIDYLSNQELGFNEENMVIINMQDTSVLNRLDFIKAELMNNPKVIGVVKNFNAFSLDTAIEPIVIFHWQVNPFIINQANGGALPAFHISIRSRNTISTMDYIEQTFVNIYPN